MNTYNKIPDEQLICRLRNGEDEIMDYLMIKYKSMVRRKARAMYLIGGDNDDLIQEGMIGLFKAIRDYEQGRDCSFRTFAVLCVKRQICTAVTRSNRKKHYPLNTYISFYSQDKADVSLMDILAAEECSDPEANLLMQEKLGGILEKINTLLSRYEHRVLELYLNGQSYGQIAEELGKSEKSVDNAIQRIRKKLSTE